MSYQKVLADSRDLQKHAIMLYDYKKETVSKELSALVFGTIFGTIVGIIVTLVVTQ
jgi:hypothetical protein